MFDDSTGNYTQYLGLNGNIISTLATSESHSRLLRFNNADQHQAAAEHKVGELLKNVQQLTVALCLHIVRISALTRALAMLTSYRMGEHCDHDGRT